MSIRGNNTLSVDTIQIPRNFKGETIEISSVKIRYVQIGAGQDIFLIHGTPGSIEDWEPVMGALALEYRVTAYDRPGQGFSSAENIGYNLEHNAHIAFGLINKLNLKNVIVVGHSYGGSVIMALAVNNPHQVKAFITLGGATYPSGYINPILYIIKIPVLGSRLIAAAARFIGPKMIEKGIIQAFKPNENTIPENYLNIRLEIWLQTKVLISTAREEMNLTPDLKKIIPAFERISKKFFIIHGDDDALVPKSCSLKLHKAISNSKLLVLSNTGHQVQYARPNSLIRTIKKATEN